MVLGVAAGGQVHLLLASATPYALSTLAASFVFSLYFPNSV
jgi:hypothetical protein